MKLLLDTHAFLWLNDDSDRLSETVKDLCSAGIHQFYLSMASAWELQIKSQIGKLSLHVAIDELVSKNCNENNIKLLPIDLSHICLLEQLPLHHRDPFDRIIIAQAVSENMSIISVDNAFIDYPITVVW